MNAALLWPLAKNLHRLTHRMYGYLFPLCFGLASLTAHLLAEASPSTAVSTADQNFHMAIEAQSEKNYAEMVRLLRKSAETGHMEAQEMLGTVLLVGPTLYGSAVKMDRCEASEWMRLAALQGSEIGKYHLTFLNRLKHAPSGKDVCRVVKK